MTLDLDDACSDAVPLDISADTIRTWSAVFDEDYRRLWHDIEFLVCRLSDSDKTGLAFHHLVLAIGNFKRQREIQTYLPPPLSLPTVQPRPQTISVLSNGERIDLNCFDPDDWKRIDDIPGIAEPTASALLAALWPEHHAIFDVRVTNAMVALQTPSGRARWAYRPRQHRDTDIPDRSWSNYDIYRRTLLATALKTGTSLQETERFLFLLDKATKPVKGRTYDELAKAIRKRMDQAPPAQLN